VKSVGQEAELDNENKHVQRYETPCGESIWLHYMLEATFFVAQIIHGTLSEPQLYFIILNIKGFIMKGFVFLMLVLILWGCGDAIEKFDGLVMSKNTREPVGDVAIIRVYNPDSYIYHTDSDGTFHLSFIVGYLTDEKFIFKKEGYLPHEQNLHFGNHIDTVYLEKK
jgi:hypothetical protein